MDIKLTPMPRPKNYPVVEILSLKESPGIASDDVSISALPPLRGILGLCCGIFRTELAICKHVWFFTTRRTSREGIALTITTGIHHHYWRLLLVHASSLTFKLHKQDLCRIKSCFAFTLRLRSVCDLNLALFVRSLTHVPKRTNAILYLRIAFSSIRVQMPSLRVLTATM